MSESRHRHWARSALVVFQVAPTLVVVVSAGLMIRAFRALIEVDPRFVMPSEIQAFRVDMCVSVNWSARQDSNSPTCCQL